MEKKKITSYRAIEVHVPDVIMKELGFLCAFWGADIWINDTPMIKLGIVVNIIVWTILFYTK